jgi:hypothetical protein
VLNAYARKKPCMSTLSTLYVSADVSMQKLDVASATSSTSYSWLARFDNEMADWEALCAQVTARAAAAQATSIHLIVEPTGGYEQGLVAYAKGWRVSLVNPLHVRRWGDGLGVRAKTDRQDALLLARYGATIQPPAQDEMDEGAAELDELLRRKDDLEKLQQAERNRLDQAKHKPRTPAAVRQSLERTLQTLSQELQALEAAIEQLLKERETLQSQRQLLRSAPAIGEKLSLAGLPRWEWWRKTTGGVARPRPATAREWQEQKAHLHLPSRLCLAARKALLCRFRWCAWQQPAQSFLPAPARRRQSQESGVGCLCSQSPDLGVGHFYIEYPL